MTNQTPEIITKFEVLFALRTGVKVLVQKVPAFDACAEKPVTFKISPDNAGDILIDTGAKPVLLKGLNKNHLDAAISKGFIMFYEMKGEDMVRSTLCNYKKS